MNRIEALLDELTSEREAFLSALEAVDLELVTVPGVVEDWSVRDLIVHVAFWAEHATEALRLAASGRGAEFAYNPSRTDGMNARLLQEAHQITPDAAVAREERAFEGLVAALTDLDPDLLEVPLGNGHTPARVVGYDGPEHYREHTAHLRAWFDEPDEPDEP
ncbi:MAG: maleylpyruvate isomerase N-terminal domain-containing protein [Chloroflexota bacterium]|nr:maleylpyruvate isomerase N-terminal domain-containing protein [Chloroflexota bacterium]